MSVSVKQANRWSKCQIQVQWKPFGQCAEVLTCHTIQKYLVPIVDIVPQFLDSLTDDELKKESKTEAKNDALSSIVKALKHLIYRLPNQEDTIRTLEIFRLKMILRLLQISSFNGKMNALNEVNKVIANVSFHSSRHTSSDEDEWLTAEKMAIFQFIQMKLPSSSHVHLPYHMCFLIISASLHPLRIDVISINTMKAATQLGLWWKLLLHILLCIGCVESNPGPRKRTSNISKRASAEKKKLYMKQYRLSQNIASSSNDDVPIIGNHKPPLIRAKANKKLCVATCNNQTIDTHNIEENPEHSQILKIEHIRMPNHNPSSVENTAAQSYQIRNGPSDSLICNMYANTCTENDKQITETCNFQTDIISGKSDTDKNNIMNHNSGDTQLRCIRTKKQLHIIAFPPCSTDTHNKEGSMQDSKQNVNKCKYPPLTQAERKAKSRLNSVIKQQERVNNCTRIAKSHSNPQLKQTETEKDIVRKHNLRTDTNYKRNENDRDIIRKRNVRTDSKYKKEENVKDKTRLRSLRTDSKYKKEENVKDKTRLRSLRTDSKYKKEENVKDKTRLRSLRTDSKYKRNEYDRDIIRKRNVRTDSKYKKEENVKDKTRLRSLRTDSKYKRNEYDRDIIRKRNVRTDPKYKKEKNVEDKTRLRSLRSDAKYKTIENKKDMEGKSKRRSDPNTKLKEDKINSDSKKRQRSIPFRKEAERLSNLESHRKRRKDESAENRKIKRQKYTGKKNQEQQNIETVALCFKNVIQEGPVYVCTSCNRTLYRHSVQHVPSHRYRKKQNVPINNILTGSKDRDDYEWICTTCHRTLMKGKLPTQNVYNGLQLDPIPEELSKLCPLEARLVSQRLPFMQIFNLPKGGQKGIHGPVINVPSRLTDIMTTLPRIPTTTGLVPLKLKRKLEYKGHALYQCIQPEAVTRALQYLLMNNPLYKNITVCDDWVKYSFEADKSLADQLFSSMSDDNSDNDNKQHSDEIQGIDEHDSLIQNPDEHDTVASQNPDKRDIDNTDKEQNLDEHDTDNNKNPQEDESDDDKSLSEKDQLKGLPFNTCLQPTDFQPDKTLSSDSIVSVAPGEGQHPVSMLTDVFCEPLAFPVEFPKGNFAMNETNREVPVSAKKYFNQRVLNADPRFARNIEYLFFAQYFTEMKQIHDGINIAMRKGCSKATEKAPTAGTVVSDCTELLQQNEAYRFIQHIRGSYPYWERTLSDLNAMVRQLGIPTWFITLSAADLRWPETIQIIARQYGENLTEEDVANMDWQGRCSWIRRNPVTAARHFDYRVQQFLHGVLLSAAKPVGHINDYFIRVEFQQRGSPHIHGLFWIEGAPIIGKQDDADICAFIDRYISTQLPDNDEVLHQLVTSLQTHSHSSTCKKSGKKCRFHFPRPPTNKTIISHPLTVDDVNPEHIKLQKEFNAEILKLVYDKLEDSSDKSLEDILLSVAVSSEQYMEALDRSASSTSIITKKTHTETYINNYNPQLLKIWQANMDIQYVTDPWACAMYILSYISKGERQMGKLLKEAAKEVTSKNDSIRKQMKQVGNVFLNHREVSAQEAVYRLLSIPLKRSSRHVDFVSTGSPESRIHILKPTKALQMLPKDSEDIFQHGVIDRYAARPPSLHSMCLADFASLYRVDYVSSKKDMCEDEIKNEDDSAGVKLTLQNGMGTMKKRTRRIIIRTPRFSKVKTPEKYYRSILMLYLPWMNEHQDLLNECETYEAHYESTRLTVDANMSIFEHNAEELDDAFNNFDQSKADNAWDAIASETQHQVEDQIEEGKLLDEACLDPGQLMGSHSALELDSSSDVSVYSVELQTDRLTTEEYNSIVQSLNQKQRHFFDHMLDWSRQNVQNRNISQTVQPFHIFLSGGAGTGKSHLIKAVVSMMRRELQTLCESPDGVTVLLAAPTGCAATNIDGTTLHQALSIPVQQNSKHGEYQPLSNDKLATLRFHLQSLKVLIIDEISMVGLPMLWYIHRRLQDIMGSTSEGVCFGGVSVLAVGDLFQLQPVRQRPVYGVFQDLYARLNPTHIWQDIFQLFELSEVMRQKDDLHLAELLNRVRLANTTKEDIEVLQTCEISTDDKNYPISALHIYPTNFQVDQHNNRRLQTLKGPLRNIKAKDTKKGVLTGKAEMKIPDNPSQTGGLREMLTVAEGARVMIIKNIDVADGLVNGAQGTIVGFLDSSNDRNANFPLAIMVQFDKASVGKNLRVKFKRPPGSPIPIQPDEARFSVGRYSQADVIRKQFPLTLCFAATIHKVQGISVSEIVVSFDGQYHGGQAYVALSRCTSLAGLHLQNFDKKKIIVSKTVEHEMTRLRQEKYFTSDLIDMLTLLPSVEFSICHLNIRSLPAHYRDLQCSQSIMACNVVCLSETWMHPGKHSMNYLLDKFKLVRRDRQTLEKKNSSMSNDRGGVAIYIRDNLHFSRHTELEPCDIEAIVISLSLHLSTISELYIATIYRPDHISLQIVENYVNHIIHQIPTNSKLVVTGDFNVDLSVQDEPKFTHLGDPAMTQLIHTPTHRLGSILDHIYVSQTLTDVQAAVVPQYYTDHAAVLCMLHAPVDVNNNKITPIVQVENIVRPVGKSVSCNTTPKMCQPKTQKPRKCNPTCAVVKKQKRTDVICTGQEDGNLSVSIITPPTLEDKQKVAAMCGVPLMNDPITNPSPRDHSYRAIIREMGSATVRQQIDVMDRDGNCFFNFISKELLGTERYHLAIRHIICNFMELHPHTFSDWYHGGMDEFTEHVDEMCQDGKWAEEVELLATASYFNTTIWEYTNSYPVGSPWKWIQIQPVTRNEKDPPFNGIPLHGCLYMHHTAGNHFDRICPPPAPTL